MQQPNNDYINKLIEMVNTNNSYGAAGKGDSGVSQKNFSTGDIIYRQLNDDYQIAKKSDDQE
jgi:hypothetical protein